MIQAHQIVLTSQTWTKNKSVKLPRNCKAWQKQLIQKAL
jgi:hypothetical protein